MDEIDAKTRLTELARRHFGDENIVVDENFYTAAYGRTLKEIIEDPAMGEKTVIDYWNFKMAGGYE